MKHKLLIYFSLFSLFFYNSSKAQDFQWVVKPDPDNNSSYTRSIVTDSKGNIYSIGVFSGIVDFDPSNSVFNLTGTIKSGIFILKLDKNKNFIWAKQIDGQAGLSICLDKNENVIITGQAFGLEIDLNPDSLQTFLIDNPTNGTGAFIVKLTSDGNFIFGNFYLGAYADESTVDDNDNIITTGVVGGINTDFDAGTNIYHLNPTSSDIFILKNKSNGVFLWAKKWGGYGYDRPTSLTCDKLNNIILTGNFENSVSFANITYGDPNNTNFIFKIDFEGNDIWFRKLGTEVGGSSFEDKSVKTDSSNNIYFTTGYSNNYSSSIKSLIINFGNITLSFTSNAYDSLFFKLSPNGEYIWHNNIYGDEEQQTNSLSFDLNNNIYLVTTISGTTFINNECNKVFPIKNISYSREYLLLKFNQNGKFINFKNIRNGSYVQTDFENNIILSGIFRDKSDFDPSPISSFFMHSFYGTSYILKLSPCTSNIPEADNDQYFCSLSNPTINDLKPCTEIINWYESKTSNIPLERNLLLENGKIYYAAYFESCKENDRLAVTAHLKLPANIPILINSTFCKKDKPKLSNISITGSNLKWYDNSTGGNELPISTLLQNNTVYFVSQNKNTDGCESYRLPVTPNLLGTELIITTPQTFCIQQNATLASIQITGSNLKWYNTQTAGALLSNTTLLQNGVTYYASQTINGCESERIPVTVNIQNTVAPTGETNQPFCTGQNPTVANIQISGNAVKWYDSLYNGSLLAETTNLIDGKPYYTSQTINGCEGPRFGVTVSIVNTPSAPTGNANQQFCKSENATLSNIQITGQNIKWYDTSFSAATLPNSTLLENNRTYYASQTIGCESDRIPILVQIYDTPLPTGNSNQQFCIDENATIGNLSISGSAIKWYDAATNGNVLPETSLLQNRIYYASQTLNNCESKRLAITVKIQDTKKPIADSRQTFCIQENALLENINITGQSIKWFENSSSTIPVTESTPLKNGMTYYASQTIANCESDRIPVTINILEATNQNCIHLVEELPFPKFFTPNNDGYNDTWTIDFGYLAPDTAIQIFDRYGKFIKELTKNTSWDGTYLGKNEATSDYWFTATRSNGKEYRGHFTLKR